MANDVTIRGRIENTLIAKGVQMTVSRTETIDRLIKGGFVEVIDHANTDRD